ncbi:MAG TPA: hypothetical protein VMV69_00345 [Pirellulales bacterium]|nr:hypothetical protein [Pirellulales bacterium]
MIHFSMGLDTTQTSATTVPITREPLGQRASRDVQPADGIEFSDGPADLKARFRMRAMLAIRAYFLCKADEVAAAMLASPYYSWPGEELAHCAVALLTKARSQCP